MKKPLAEKLWAIQEAAHTSAIHYFQKSPVQSVRVMEPSGAIFVILADGREVLVPQPPSALGASAVKVKPRRKTVPKVIDAVQQGKRSRDKGEEPEQ